MTPLPRTATGAIDWDRMLVEHEAEVSGSRAAQLIDRMADELRREAPLRRLLIAVAWCREGWMR